MPLPAASSQLWLLLLVDLLSGTNNGLQQQNQHATLIRYYSDPPAIDQIVFQVVFLLACAAGAAASGPLTVLFGYKRPALVLLVASLLFNCLSMIWDSVTLLVMRILTGLVQGALSVIVPRWLSYLATPRDRGYIIVFYQMLLTYGILMFYVILAAEQYYPTFVVAAILCAAQGIACLFLRDTPRAHDGSYTNIDSVPLREQFKSYRNVINLLFIGIAQQMTGINVVIQTAASALEYGSIGSQHGSYIVTSGNFIATCLCFLLINTYGRRFSYFLGQGLCIAGQIILIITHTIFDRPSKSLLLCGSIIFLLGFELGPGPGFFLVMSEAMNGAYSAGIGLCTTYIFNAIVIGLYDPLQYHMNWYYAIMMASQLITTSLLWFSLVETSNKTLYEISTELLLDGKLCTARGGISSRYWCLMKHKNHEYNKLLSE